MSIITPLLADQVNYSHWASNRSDELNKDAALPISKGDRQRSGEIPSFDEWRNIFTIVTRKPDAVPLFSDKPLGERLRLIALRDLIISLKHIANEKQAVEKMAMELLQEDYFGEF